MADLSIWEMFMGRTDGPMIFRLIIQPTVAAIFAVRAGLRDAREQRTPFLWAVISDSENRRAFIRRGWNDVGRLFVIAVVLDVIYELIVFRWVYPGQAVVVAALLAIVPYLAICGPVTRLVRRFL